MPIPIKQNKITDPGEKERILMLYAGIFPQQIEEFAETISHRVFKKKTNQSK